MQLTCRWDQLPWYGKMASKLLLLPKPEYTPYLNVLPEVSLPAMWSRDDIEELQCEYMIEKVRNACGLAAVLSKEGRLTCSSEL